MDLKGKKILLTGGAGFLGKAVMKKLLERGVKEGDVLIPRSKIHDLRKKEACEEVVKNKDIVIHVAGAVGGLGFVKNNPATAFYDNASMSLHLIYAARATATLIKKIPTSYPRLSERSPRQKKQAKILSNFGAQARRVGNFFMWMTRQKGLFSQRRDMTSPSRSISDPAAKSRLKNLPKLSRD